MPGPDSSSNGESHSRRAVSPRPIAPEEAGDTLQGPSGESGAGANGQVAEAAPKGAYCQDDLAGVLLTAEQIAARVAELGREITRDYAGKPLVVLGVLNGVVIFLADLLRHLDLPCEVDFVTLASYGNSAVSSGQVTMMREPRLPLEGKRVLVVEDIVDTGRTLAWLVNWLRERAAEVKVCCLLDKASRREVPVQLDYVGFEIPDAFVVGYGLDFAQAYRNLPYVAVLSPKVYQR